MLRHPFFCGSLIGAVRALVPLCVRARVYARVCVRATQVEQYQQVVPFEDQMFYLYALLQNHVTENPTDYKVSQLNSLLSPVRALRLESQPLSHIHHVTRKQ
jgi:uncharacterized Fe-S cluster-containing radical SAM superfamily protein